MAAKYAGRGTSRFRRTRRGILEASDICVWCGHDGARAVNHDTPLSVDRSLAEDPDNMSPIHGVEGCPVCPWRWSRKLRRLAARVCNSELGTRPLHEALTQRAAGSRDW